MRVGLWVVLFCLHALTAPAQDLSALARLAPERSLIEDRGDAPHLQLGLSQAVPWRVRLLDGPPRLVLDFREVDWRGLDQLAQNSDHVRALRAGTFRPGWSRLVLELDGPYRVARAEMQTGAEPLVDIRLEASDAESFAEAASRPDPAQWALPEPARLPPAAPQDRAQGRVRVVLDPGHGGIDPGAERDGLTEAGLMLTFARELREVLLRDGLFEVILTRDEDVFVPLESRISIARDSGADLFLSLHADALAEGDATGATIYRLARDASDAAARALAERHDRDDLLAGVDLSQQDDLMATVLMDMARTVTAPRIDRLAQTLSQSLRAAGVQQHRHPIQQADFSVLKSPDIPSLLLEVGFLSSSADRARLTDATWRGQLASALRDGLLVWARDEAALSALREN